MAAGDVDATRQLARRWLQRGDLEVAYLLGWRAGAGGAEQEALGQRLAGRQRQTLEALASRPSAFSVALDARRRGARVWSFDWCWVSVERARAAGAPVLALRAERALDADRLAAAVRGLGTLVSLELAGGAAPPLTSALQGARLLGSLRLRGTPVTARELDRLRPSLPSLVHLALLPHEAERRRVTDGQLRALGRFPRLARVELREGTGFGAAGVAALARAPSMTWIEVEGCTLRRASLQRAVRAAGGDVGFGSPSGVLRGLLPWPLSVEVRRLFDLADDPDPTARRVARETSRRLLLSEDQELALRAAVPLLRVGLTRSPVDLTYRAVVALAVRGIEISPLLPDLTEAARREGGLAEWALRRCALLGWDLRPCLADDEGDDLRRLAEAYSRAPADVRGALSDPTPWNLPSVELRELHRAVERGLASGDTALRAAAGEAALALNRKGPEVLSFLIQAGLGGDARALAQVAPLLHRGLPLAADWLRRLAACLTAAHPAAPAAGQILWTAARRGHDMAPAIERLQGAAAGSLRWGVDGPSPALAAVLGRLGAVEALPPGVSRTPRHGHGDEEQHPRRSGRTCGACGSADTVCIFSEAFGSNAGGAEVWESRCLRCGLYTHETHEWG